MRVFGSRSGMRYGIVRVTGAVAMVVVVVTLGGLHVLLNGHGGGSVSEGDLSIVELSDAGLHVFSGIELAVANVVSDIGVAGTDVTLEGVLDILERLKRQKKQLPANSFSRGEV